MGPDNAYLYLGPESSSGFVVYGGNRTHIPMNFFLRPGRREGSLCVLQCLESIVTQNFTVQNSLFIPIGPGILDARTEKTTNGKSGRIVWRCVFYCLCFTLEIAENFLSSFRMFFTVNSFSVSMGALHLPLGKSVRQTKSITLHLSSEITLAWLSSPKS